MGGLVVRCASSSRRVRLVAGASLATTRAGSSSALALTSPSRHGTLAGVTSHLAGIIIIR
jgi:hypothetical protein